MHEKDQSRHNYIYDFGTGTIGSYQVGFAKSEKLAMKETNRLSTSDDLCNQDNSNTFTSCIHQFKEKHLGCRLPWRKGQGTGVIWPHFKKASGT